MLEELPLLDVCGFHHRCVCVRLHWWCELYKDYSPDLNTGKMLTLSAQFDTELGCCFWWAKVPSAGHLADAPFRLDLSTLAKYGYVQLKNKNETQHCPVIHDSRGSLDFHAVCPEKKDTAWTHQAYTHKHLRPRPALKLRS